MSKLELLNRAVREINRVKKVKGYVYSKTDCWSLFVLYDSFISLNDNLKNAITHYATPRTFHNKVKDLGYDNVTDMLIKNGYEEIVIDFAEAGDICLFNSPVADYTISIFDGETWVNSSNEPAYEKLPTRFIKSRAVFIGRKELQNERI